MNTDPLSDFLTRIRNAQHARMDSVDIPSSRMKFAIAKIFEREGYVGAVT
ncbi:MAG: 30S ribosomal protein S8, partial [Patescibacteria group bacterium]